MKGCWFLVIASPCNAPCDAAGEVSNHTLYYFYYRVNVSLLQKHSAEESSGWIRVNQGNPGAVLHHVLILSWSSSECMWFLSWVSSVFRAAKGRAATEPAAAAGRIKPLNMGSPLIHHEAKLYKNQSEDVFLVVCVCVLCFDVDTEPSYSPVNPPVSWKTWVPEPNKSRTLSCWCDESLCLRPQLWIHFSFYLILMNPWKSVMDVSLCLNLFNFLFCLNEPGYVFLWFVESPSCDQLLNSSRSLVVITLLKQVMHLIL